MNFDGTNLKRICLTMAAWSTVFIAITLTGCSGSSGNAISTKVGLYSRNIAVDSVTRKYAYYVPDELGDGSHPLVVELHGGGVYIEDMTGESGHKTPYKLWMDIADREKFIVVYPEGLNGTYKKPTWNDCRENAIVSSDADDVHFISALIDEISSSYNIDPNRIYVSGTSNGGIMALRLAIELSDRIAAVAATVAAMPDVSSCASPVEPISVLFMNGTNDNNLPYDGGTIGNPPNPDHGTVYSTDVSVNIWTTVNETDTSPTIYSFPDIDTEDGGIVTKYTYSNGINGTEVILYNVLGGGHSAPSIVEQYSALFELYFNKQNHDIEMTTEVWNFFKNNTLNY
ncbi:MAG: alpha/beta hydrolase fold domain-containing protein [Proteobacteria bacterium]|nr:alpha/beta hydrolase fold domain-containing protein [Pseudomonadota bacterium]